MTERQINSLESKFAAGNYYDLLQSYKALYFRNSNAKKFNETVALLMSGATNFIKYKQWNCAAELSQLLVETYKLFKTPYTEETKNNIVKLFVGFDEDCSAAVNFMREAIKWSAEYSSEKKGSSEFHTLLAHALHKSGDYIDAQKHYIFGYDPISFSHMLKEWTEEVDKLEEDLFIARACFGYLCVNKLKDAKILFTDFTSHKDPGSFTPLLNYIRFLLITLDRGNVTLFQTLKQKYQPSIKRDPDFSKYLDQIANVFYKVPIPSNGGFGSLLSSMFGGGGGMGGLSGLFGGGNRGGNNESDGEEEPNNHMDMD